MTIQFTAGAPLGGASKSLVPIRFRKVAGKILLTNPWGDWIALSPEEFDELRSRDAFSNELSAKLRERRFLRADLPQEALIQRLTNKTRFLGAGPNLHILVVTLRCNETCVYCHASRAEMDRLDTDMSVETAERAIDLALSSTSPGITIEFQGGEPLVNFAVVRHAIEYAIERNRAYDKTLDFTLISNLALMDDEKLDYLVGHRVQICTSIDGPAALHDKQRKLIGGSAHGEAVKWIRRINERYETMGLDPTLYRVEALLTTTRESLRYPKEIVDAYASLGCRALFLRPVDPFGFASRTGGRIGIEHDDYLAFYATAVDYMIDLNRQGVQVLERYAGIFLTKILTESDPNFLDIRSPCGAGIGQLAYDHDGRIYTCDEGRMLAASGDPTFQIGALPSAPYRDLMKHETVRALVMASNLDAQPDCTSCVYRPYCGVCPVYNYATQGSIHGRMRDSGWCRVHKGIQDYLFTKLIEGDPGTAEILRRWTTARERTHYIHSGAAS
ncbi:MAG: His-Xaa-Ser system radical SAM maturase HxsB [Polyangiaceae bacterium]|nr:His-Xaa-Ser system radical SAM maturase HxsB [Polyangiaceae bacterium]NUQ76795.1 His-Xaa-Ser system radical SAM maturase HxsB [Polyangiaceae bacterium]